jgi:glycosyltransferase involved in cell wall biosynthesis
MHLIVRMPIGGVENQLLSIVKLYDKRKYNVLLCCIKDLGELGLEAKRCGINIIELGLMKSNRFDLRIVWKILKVLKTHNIHILRTHQYVANLYGRLAAIFAKTPVVISSFHTLYTRPKRHRSFLNRFLAEKSDFLVAVSNAVAEDMLKYDRVNRSKLRIIYNGVDLKKFNHLPDKEQCRKDLGLPQNKIILGNVGNIVEAKNHKIILKVLVMLKRHDIVALFVGEGRLKDELQNLSKKFGISDKVIFLGKLHPEKIPLFLRSLDIFCFPSLWEGFSTAVIEAMAAGLPVVASDIPPHKEVVGDAAILTPTSDKDKLAEALKMLIKNPSLSVTLSKKAKDRAGLFSIENTVKAYEDLFEKTLKQKNLL